MQRYFHIFYPDRGYIQKCLDSIVFLANPNEKIKTHVTFRGPYETKVEILPLERKIQGQVVSVLGVDRFRNIGQNTIFLRCGTKNLRDVWSKTDFSYNPHITIYDGESSVFANRLYETLKNHRLYFSMIVGEIAIIKSTKGQKSFEFVFDIDLDWIKNVTGLEISWRTASEMPDWRRLMHIDRLCTRLSEFSRQRPVWREVDAR